MPFRKNINLGVFFSELNRIYWRGLRSGHRDRVLEASCPAEGRGGRPSARAPTVNSQNNSFLKRRQFVGADISERPGSNCA